MISFEIMITHILAAVTMQAQEVAPPEMQCKDKFLVQSTLVSFGTSEDEITSNIVRRVFSIGFHTSIISR